MGSGNTASLDWVRSALRNAAKRMGRRIRASYTAQAFFLDSMAEDNLPFTGEIGLVRVSSTHPPCLSDQ